MQRKETMIMKTRNFKIAAMLMTAIMACSLTACKENVENAGMQDNENTLSTPINTEAATEANTEASTEANTEAKTDSPEEDTAPAPEETTAADNTVTDSSKTEADTVENEVQFSSDPLPLTSETGRGEVIAKLAAAQEGVMYKYACAAPDKGFDNSGLIYYVFTENGIPCPRLTCDIAQLGSKIKYDQLQIGDLAFFEYDDDGSVIIYGGIYLGDGKMIVSMSEGIPVKVVDITTQYYRSNFAWGVCVAR